MESTPKTTNESSLFIYQSDLLKVAICSPFEQPESFSIKKVKSEETKQSSTPAIPKYKISRVKQSHSESSSSFEQTQPKQIYLPLITVYIGDQKKNPAGENIVLDKLYPISPDEIGASNFLNFSSSTRLSPRSWFISGGLGTYYEPQYEANSLYTGKSAFIIDILNESQVDSKECPELQDASFFNCTYLDTMIEERSGHRLYFDQKRNRVLAVGGCNHNEGYLDSVQSFDLDKKTWTLLGKMPNKRARFTGTIQGDSLFIFGGYSDYGESQFVPIDQVSVLNLVTNQWKEINIKQPLTLKNAKTAEAHSFYFDNQFYLIGGGKGEEEKGVKEKPKVQAITVVQKIRVKQNKSEANNNNINNENSVKNENTNNNNNEKEESQKQQTNNTSSEVVKNQSVNTEEIKKEVEGEGELEEYEEIEITEEVNENSTNDGYEEEEDEVYVDNGSNLICSFNPAETQPQYELSKFQLTQTVVGGGIHLFLKGSSKEEEKKVNTQLIICNGMEKEPYLAHYSLAQNEKNVVEFVLNQQYHLLEDCVGYYTEFAELHRDLIPIVVSSWNSSNSLFFQ